MYYFFLVVAKFIAGQIYNFCLCMSFPICRDVVSINCFCTSHETYLNYCRLSYGRKNSKTYAKVNISFSCSYKIYKFWRKTDIKEYQQEEQPQKYQVNTNKLFNITTRLCPNSLSEDSKNHHKRPFFPISSRFYSQFRNATTFPHWFFGSKRINGWNRLQVHLNKLLRSLNLFEGFQ